MRPQRAWKPKGLETKGLGNQAPTLTKPEWHEVKHSGEGCKGAGSRGRGRMYTQISAYPAGAKCFFLPTQPVLSASFSLLVKLPAPGASTTKKTLIFVTFDQAPTLTKPLH
jgi:hypothetical protein